MPTINSGYKVHAIPTMDVIAATGAGSPVRVVTDPADCPPMAPQ
jgi:hypothetical protein